jgi:hypothetical protein
MEPRRAAFPHRSSAVEAARVATLDAPVELWRPDRQPNL